MVVLLAGEMVLVVVGESISIISSRRDSREREYYW